jgi:tetratricopeptide (TPR) repeat protein
MPASRKKIPRLRITPRLSGIEEPRGSATIPSMPVTKEKDLPDNLKAVWLKAMSAMELKNFGYASQLYQSILKAHPEFLLARQLARKAAIAKNAGKKGMLGAFSSASFSTMKVQSLVKKDPVAALEAIEKSLENDPFNPQINQILREAALAANLPDTAEFALQTIIDGNPKDTRTMHELAKLYLNHAKPQRAVDVYNRILQVAPNDLAAIKGGKDASAAASMLSGGWERDDATYRDLMKNRDEAVALEQKGRVVRSDEVIDNLLKELHLKVETEPESIDASRRIAELYEQKEDLANAIAWYTYAASLTNNSDASLVRKVSDLRIKQFDHSITEFEHYIAENPGTDEAKACEEQLADLRRQRAELLLDDARRRVERNPTDLMARFELGAILVNLEKYREATSELQKARQNPAVHLRAVNLLGQCYSARGMLDLAAETLELAVSELPVMDGTKKETVYNLGIVYEKMGNIEKAIQCMKQIYSVDADYRDVEQRVEGSYMS